MTGPAVLTEASTLTCPHQGAVSAKQSTRLTVKGKAVLLAPLAGAAIDCHLPDDPNTSTMHCKTAQQPTAGESSKLTVGGTSVLLATLAGMTDGTPPPVQLAPAVAKQDRLHAAVKP